MKGQLKALLICSSIAITTVSAHEIGDVYYGYSQENCGGTCLRGETALLAQPFRVSANALFDTDKSTLRANGQSLLTELAARIKNAQANGTVGTGTSIFVAGHADSRASVKYNQGLSERRAQAVKDFLIAQGVNSDIILAFGKSELEPRATNKTAYGRQLNRRVEIQIEGDHVGVTDN